MQNQTQFPFKPITLQMNHQHQNNNLPDIKLQQYYRLHRMKKVLAETQQKMENRINLFRKASSKILKQRQMEIKIFQKIQHSKTSPSSLELPRGRQNLKTADHRKETNERLIQNSIDSRALAMQLYEKRMNNARLIKQEKNRFKTIIQQRRKMDLQRKLQSANGIRRKRQNVKLVRQNLERDRRQNFRRELIEKCSRQQQQFWTIEKQLNNLQIEEQQALVLWKKTLESKN